MNNKIVVYGLGATWRRNLPYLEKEEVVGYVDKNLQNQSQLQIDVLLPDQISMLEYDYIVIFSQHSAREICEELVEECAVPREKVVDYFYYLFVMKRELDLVSLEVKRYLPIMFDKYSIFSVLDVDLSLFRLGAYSRESFLFLSDDARSLRNQEVKIVAGMLGKSYRNIMNNLYDGKQDLEDVEERFDLVLLIDMFMNYSIQNVCAILNRICKFAENIFLTLPYCESLHYEEWEKIDFSRWGKVTRVQCGQMRGVMIQERTVSEEDVKIYVVTHKKYKEPEDNLRITIQAGKTPDNSLGYKGDNTGDNVSYLNAWLNECTAMYWIWKNTKHKYVGIEHYRRHFVTNSYAYDDTNLLGTDDILHYMKTYDVIVAKHEVYQHCQVKEAFRNSIDTGLFDLVFSRTREAIAKRNAFYRDYFDEVFAGNTFYPCNLMIMPKHIYDSYCEWLFPILFEVLQGLELEKHDAYSCRVVGFMAERLLTVWLWDKDYRIKELFYCLTED